MCRCTRLGVYGTTRDPGMCSTTRERFVHMHGSKSWDVALDEQRSTSYAFGDVRS